MWTTPARWRTWFDAGDHGLADWPSIIRTLHLINYRGPICLSAQYTDRRPDQAAALARADLEWARSLD